MIFEFLCWNGRNHMGGSDFLEVNNYVKSSNPSEAYIDLTEEALKISKPHLFVIINNVKAGSFFRLSFAGELKESLSPPSVIQRNAVPQVCKSCGAPLHDGKCNYCGTNY